MIKYIKHVYLYAVQVYILNLDFTVPVLGKWLKLQAGWCLVHLGSLDPTISIVDWAIPYKKWCCLFLPWWNSLEFLETTNLLPGLPIRGHKEFRLRLASNHRLTFQTIKFNWTLTWNTSRSDNYVVIGLLKIWNHKTYCLSSFILRNRIVWPRNCGLVSECLVGDLHGFIHILDQLGCVLIRDGLSDSLSCYEQANASTAFYGIWSAYRHCNGHQ